MAEFNMENIGNALQGFGAGVAGRGQEFLQGQADRKQALSDERKQALALDNRDLLRRLNAGDITGGIKLMRSRVESIDKLGGDNTDTLQMLGNLTLAEQGDQTALQTALSESTFLDSHLVDSGLLSALPKAAKDKFEIKDGVMWRFPADGSQPSPIEGVVPPKKLSALDQQKFDLGKLNIKEKRLELDELTAAMAAKEAGGGTLDDKDFKSVTDKAFGIAKDARKIRGAAASLMKLIGKSTPAAQLAGVVTFFKAIDPTSVVKQEEGEQVYAAQGLASEMAAKLNKLQGEGGLDAAAFQDLVTTARRLANQSVEDATGAAAGYLDAFGGRLSQKDNDNIMKSLPIAFQLREEELSEDEMSTRLEANGGRVMTQGKTALQVGDTVGGATFLGVE